MAIARGRVSSLDSYYETLHGGGPSSVQALEEPSSSSLGIFGLMTHNKVALEAGERLDQSVVNYPAGHLPTLSDPSSSSSGGGGGGFVLGTASSPSTVAAESHHSILNFRTTGCNYSTYLSSSMLSFEQGEQQVVPAAHAGHHLDDYAMFSDAFEPNSQFNHLNLKYIDCRLANDRNCLESSTGNGSTGQLGEEQFGWLYSENSAGGDNLQENGVLDGAYNKRPHMGGDHSQTPKKHCSGANKKPKIKTKASKDPQSIAAKNRRERISERLKILQDLVPNGTKVDLVTMLEKAISYVKFLQLQVKVLATDEFWPAHGGKAPEVAQVKEAIDAILSSHRTSN